MYTNIPAGHKKQFKNTAKDLVFEELLNELRPLLRKSNNVDYGDKLVRFDYQGQEFEVKLKDEPKRFRCKLCGRDKFTKRSPHKCRGVFRKRDIEWEELK